MTLDQAKKLAHPYTLDKENKTIVITSDHGVHLNSDIMSVQKFAVRAKLKCFVIKGEANDIEAVHEAISDQNKAAIAEKEEIVSLRSREAVALDVCTIMKRADENVGRNDIVRARNLYMQILVLDPNNKEAAEKLDWCKTTLINEAKIEEKSKEEIDAEKKAIDEANKENKKKADAIAKEAAEKAKADAAKNNSKPAKKK